ncbi:substrate-binding domain-containing protein [Dactylosporangium darangshiense]|uniref:substrate-binding domain-containing protein n=1 Tax=Dactylosporangium darangshiense TaxID=579108 RepID=UPI0036387C43
MVRGPPRRRRDPHRSAPRRPAPGGAARDRPAGRGHRRRRRRGRPDRAQLRRRGRRRHRARHHRLPARPAPPRHRPRRGPRELLHTAQRDAAYRAAVEELGEVRYQAVYTNYSAADGMRATRELLSRGEPPTALVFDNDVMAAAALKVAHEMGLSVPEDFSVVAWDDSDLCQITVPEITAVVQVPALQAELTARALLQALGGGGETHLTLPPGTLTARQSTRPPKTRA